jgi:CRP-like cAMP-binding protein
MDTKSFFQYPGDTPAGSDPSLMFLGQCSDTEWGLLLSHMQTQSFRQGEDLVSAGASDDALYIIQDGRFEVLVPQAFGALRVVALLNTGSVFGEQAFLDGLPRSATVRAISDEGRVLCLTQDAFRALADVQPQLAVKVLFELGRILSRRLRAAPQ